MVVVGLLKLLISSPSGKSVFANYRVNAGSLATFAAMRLASSSVSDLAIPASGESAWP